ncbi:hypothetical protein IMSAGC019_01991 [Lachnospiraceae bacterium]|nr:hypothetical protein IMSAGC019_01991 [Lachnospiraceae bacterium]
MVIENKQLLNRLSDFLKFNYKDKDNFRRFCNFMSDFKETGISFDELSMAISNSFQPESKRDDIIELLIFTQNNRCYKYRVTKEIYKYLYECKDYYWNTNVVTRDFFNKEYSKCKSFYDFISDEYKTISCRSMDHESEYTGESLSFFKNIKKNQNIKNFCKMIDNLNVNDVNMFDVFEMYHSVYKCVWGRGKKYHIQERVIFDAVISFFKYSEAKRKQVKFFDFLIVDIMKKYVMGHKKLDVTEMFPHEDLTPCPFCGKLPHIYMKTFWFDLIVTIECEDCFHVMSKDVIESSGLNQEDRLYINSFTEVINALVAKWNHRIKNDDMWLDDDTLPEELPECEPDMFPKITYANGLKCCPFCGAKAGLIKQNSGTKRDGKRDPEGIKTIKVVCSKHCFSASHFGTPERIPDKLTIEYMAYRWNKRHYSEIGNRNSA